MSTSLPSNIRIAVLLDGKPGHEKQSKGILQAMQSMIEVDVIPIRVKRTGSFSLFMRSLRYFLPGDRTADQSAVNADLVLGTGSRTHLPMLEIKKKYGIPAITCMNPPLHLRAHFDLCLVPEHDGIPDEKNIMLTSGAPNSSINKGNHQSELGLILLGGVDLKSHRWDSERIQAMVRNIVRRDKNKQWTISSSPRTPEETVVALEMFARESDRVTFFNYKNTKTGWIEEQYDKNSVVWVTADSISMIYESLTAGCKVGIIPLQWKRKNSKFQRNEDLLVKKRFVVSYASWLDEGGMGLDNIELNEAQRCAEWILQKWFSKNLQ